jgi:hypothetical protein
MPTDDIDPIILGLYKDTLNDLLIYLNIHASVNSSLSRTGVEMRFRTAKRHICTEIAAEMSALYASILGVKPSTVKAKEPIESLKHRTGIEETLVLVNDSYYKRLEFLAIKERKFVAFGYGIDSGRSHRLSMVLHDYATEFLQDAFYIRQKGESIPFSWNQSDITSLDVELPNSIVANFARTLPFYAKAGKAISE